MPCPPPTIKEWEECHFPYKVRKNAKTDEHTYPVSRLRRRSKWSRKVAEWLLWIKTRLHRKSQCAFRENP